MWLIVYSNDSTDCQAHIFFFKTKNCSNDDIFISCDDRIGKMLHNICMSAVAMLLRWANRGPWASCFRCLLGRMFISWLWSFLGHCIYRLCFNNRYSNDTNIFQSNFHHLVHINTVDSDYLEFLGTLWNTSRYPYLDISDLQNWGKNNSNNHI